MFPVPGISTSQRKAKTIGDIIIATGYINDIKGGFFIKKRAAIRIQYKKTNVKKLLRAPLLFDVMHPLGLLLMEVPEFHPSVAKGLPMAAGKTR